MNGKRILFYSEGWGTGGIEAFVMNAMRSLSETDSVCDVFCTHDYDGRYDAEIARLGGVRYTVFKGEKPGLVKRLKASTKAWKQLLLQRRYDVVHINTMNGMGFVYAAFAKKVGVPVRIVHSHNTAFGEGHALIKRLAHREGKRLWSGSATHRLACSIDAGIYLFDEDPFKVVSNAFDVRRFKFDETKRSVVRKRLNIESSAFVVGNIARLTAQKNPLFLIDAFVELLGLREDAYLLLVGQGPLEAAIERRIDEVGIADRVRWIRASNDIPDLLCAMDGFCLPSCYEGLGIVLVEAQASGLPSVCSSAIPEEVAITELVCFESIERAPKEWAHKILELSEGGPHDRTVFNEEVMNTSFTLAALGKELQEIYHLGERSL